MTKLQEFQALLIKHQIDAYLIPTADYHESEYVSDFFKVRAYLSGFKGSAGTLLILKKEAYLWTDGRYFIQAERDLANTGITLMKMGVAGVPTITEFLTSTLVANNTLGFDGKTINTSLAKSIQSRLKGNVKLQDIELISELWVDRPQLPNDYIYCLEDKYSGESFNDKLSKVREQMQKTKASYHLLTALEDISWLFNLRGNDVLYTPVFLAYTLISEQRVTLYVAKNKIKGQVLAYLQDNDVKIKEYSDIYKDVKALHNETILLDENKVNYALTKGLDESNAIINKLNPTIGLKAVKNTTEIANTKHIHILDGVAVTRMMRFAKEQAKTNLLTEIAVSDYVEAERRKIPGFIELSFGTICAYKANGAMMHYSANEKSNARLTDEGFLLIDSGGTYLEGTTDITRTISLGRLSNQMKNHFTYVLKGMINLSRAIFLKGCTGVNLDILARGPIWRNLIDYKCGTGHGVGHILSVHEAPNGIRWQHVPERNDSAVLVPGMITTNEPGIYLENEYGIRTENELLCVKVGSNELDSFLGFETITICPIDLDCINPLLLNNEERDWLNNYHQTVYKELCPFLTEEEKAWLRIYTREI